MTEKLKGATRLASSSKTYGAGGVRRQRERDFGRVFTGLLFALFVATLLMAILAGTDVYRGLNREGDAAGQPAAFAYAACQRCAGQRPD